MAGGWRSSAGSWASPKGLDVIDALGSARHWIITPIDPAGRPPTYGTGTTLRNGRRRPVAGAEVRLAGARARTSARGTARLTMRITRPGRDRATARRADLRTGAVTVRFVAAKQDACALSPATAQVARC